MSINTYSLGSEVSARLNIECIHFFMFQFLYICAKIHKNAYNYTNLTSWFTYWGYLIFRLSPYPSVLDFGKIKFNELHFYSISNWIVTACVACKNQFWIDFCRLKIQFVELDFSNLILEKIEKSTTYGKGESLT